MQHHKVAQVRTGPCFRRDAPLYSETFKPALSRRATAITTARSLRAPKTTAEWDTMSTDDNQSLGDGATFAGQAKRRPAGEMSLGDERTLGDAAVSGLDTVIDDTEVVDLEARYKPEGTLGQGGMGAVLLATDTRLDRKVAIKRILGEAAGNRMAVQRFLTEAKSIAALNHPNVVQIYDYGRAKDGPFLIMEYVDGGSLLDRCRGEAIPLEEAIDLASALCDGLAKAHDLGIVHRDIKPANVLLTKDGIPKLTDFGLAKAEAGDHGQTMTGAVLGTPDFMPPEQRRDASLVDARSDLWSLAATVYQMVTGKSPKIIRFKDVPEAIQDVLGKALEDEKAARYQTVREFRDALKTSLRAAAPAPVSLGEGLCPSCGTKNDSSRRFCRSCSGSLEAPCLSCDKGMPYWEEICGQCGAKQEPLVAERTAAMVAKQADAESRLKDFDFNAAESLARAMQGEKDPRFNQFAKWSEQFLPRIRESREQQRVRAAGLLREAIRHEQAHDYHSAIHTLEQVPNALHSEALPELDSSVESALARVRGKQTDCERLESRIKAAIASRELGSLMPDVESMLTLKPDRKDVQRIQAQLLERQAKLACQRDDAVARAAGLIAEHNYPAALAALTAIDRSVETSESTRLRERAEGLVRTVQELRSRIKQAVADKRLDGLLGEVDALLQLVPENAEALKLRETLLSRESKLEADLAGIRKGVEAAWQGCRFSNVVKGIERIPEGRRTPEDTARFDSASDLAMWQVAFANAAAKASGLEEFSQALSQGKQYAAMLEECSLQDSHAQEEMARCEREHAKLEAELANARRLQRSVLITLVFAISAAVFLGLISAGLLVRSMMRDRAFNRAVAEARWDDALSIVPRSAAALSGRAQARLSAADPDLAAAFRDIDAAEAIDSSSQQFKDAKAWALALRAVDHAKAGRASEAKRDYRSAERLSSSCPAVAAASAAIGEAFLTRGQDAAAKKDTAGLAAAMSEATAFGIQQDRVADLLLQYARNAAHAGDVKLLADACGALERYAVRVDEAGSLWQECARSCADKVNLVGLATAVEQGKIPQDQVVQAWRRLASRAVDRLDFEIIQTACAHMPTEDAGDLWLMAAARASEDSKVDLVARACQEAENCGVSASRLAAPKAQQLLLEAASMHGRGDNDKAVNVWVKAFHLAFEAGEYGIAYQAYRSVAPVDEEAASRLRATFDTADSHRLITKFPDVSRSLGIDAIVERFSDTTTPRYVHVGGAGVSGTIKDGDTSFFRLTSGGKTAGGKSDPYAVAFAVPFAVTDTEAVEISFRCRRKVTSPEGNNSLLALEFTKPAESLKEVLIAPRLASVALYNNERFVLQRNGHAVVGLSMGNSGMDGHVLCGNEQEWLKVTLWLHRADGRASGQSRVFLWTFVNDSMPLAYSPSGGRSLLGPWAISGSNGEQPAERFAVRFVACGSREINRYGQREPTRGEDIRCIYDITDVTFRPIDPPKRVALTIEECKESGKE